MSITRQLSNGQMLTDWTEEVNDIANQYGLVNGSGLFAGNGTSQTSIVFDKSTNVIKLLEQTTRGGKASKGQDRKVETFSLALPYFLHQDYITPQDIQGQRKAGTPDDAETLANVTSVKLEDMRLVADQTREFMKIQALKGQTREGGGTLLADMFNELGVSAVTIDFLLGSATTDIDGKIAELKRHIAKEAKIGGRIGRIEVMVSPEFFDALTGHVKMREAYISYQVSNRRSDVVRSDLAKFETWGVVDTFEHKGVLFYSYDAEFLQDDGDGTTTTVKALGEASGYRDAEVKCGFSIVRGVRNLYKGVYGPSNTLTGANSVGSEMMVAQYRDPKDKFHELELEMAGLYYMTRPQLSVQVVSST